MTEQQEIQQRLDQLDDQLRAIDKQRSEVGRQRSETEGELWREASWEEVEQALRREEQHTIWVRCSRTEWRSEPAYINIDGDLVIGGQLNNGHFDRSKPLFVKRFSD